MWDNLSDSDKTIFDFEDDTNEWKVRPGAKDYEFTVVTSK